MQQASSEKPAVLRLRAPDLLKFCKDKEVLGNTRFDYTNKNQWSIAYLNKID